MRVNFEQFKKQIAKSELGKELINDPLMNQDVWSLKKLGYSEEECRLSGHHNLYFENFSLSWLKILTKLTIKVMLIKKKSLSTCPSAAGVCCR